MLLYIHVPFCRSKCRYCGFHSEPLADGDAIMRAFAGTGFLEEGRARQRMRLWLDTVLLEMARWADALERPAIRTVFFGGGTPSLLPPSAVGTLLNRVSRCFRLESGAEISLEANPESLTRESAAGYLRAGVNRVSLGVQSLDDGTLEFLGRAHTAAEAARAYDALRAAGFGNVNMDLMWGLPGQSVSSWLGQIGEIVRLRPEHVSAYGLSLEPGTVLASLRERGGISLPMERDQAAMYVRGAELLEEAGFLHYEVSNFARMGYQCRHNTGYWEGEDYLGLGPSATSTVGGRRRSNPADMSAWAGAVRSRGGGDEEELSLTDRALELLMLRLRTTRGLRIKAYKNLTGRDFMRDHKPLIHALHRNGLIRIRNGYLWLTRNGMLVSNSILERFFESAREHLSGGPSSEKKTPAPLPGRTDAS
jgi:oxygen-independent coproporphyrinogen-3 oxidase